MVSDICGGRNGSNQEYFRALVRFMSFNNLVLILSWIISFFIHLFNNLTHSFHQNTQLWSILWISHLFSWSMALMCSWIKDLITNHYRAGIAAIWLVEWSAIKLLISHVTRSKWTLSTSRITKLKRCCLNLIFCFFTRELYICM